MAVLEGAHSVLSSHLSSFPKLTSCPKSYPSIRRLHISDWNRNFPLKSPLCALPLLSANTNTKLARFELRSTVEEIVVEETTEEEETQKPNLRRKLFVVNLPWSYTVDDIKNTFGECGTVSDVEIIKQNNGKSRGFAFVTMASGDEAQAVIDKFDSRELSGRIIRIEFAKRFKKTKRPPAASPPAGEARHKLYVSNLAWKVRSTHLKEFFAANYNPVSVRVVFDSPSGRSAGYGFVSFVTLEEAEGAISALDGKELLGRAVRLKFSERNVEENVEESSDGKKEEDISEEPQPS